jgi:hypothetical protein
MSGITSGWSERNRINLIGVDLASIRDGDEGAVIVGYGAHGPSADCQNGHVSVTIRKNGEIATSEAVSLQDAIYLARAKVNGLIEKREEARREAAALSRARGEGE